LNNERNKEKAMKQVRIRKISIVILASALLLAACSSTSSSKGKEAKQSKAVSNEVAQAASFVGKYSKVPSYPVFKTSFTVKKNWLIYVIPVTTSPFDLGIEAAEKQLANTVGVKVVVYPTTGLASQYAAGISAAIAAHANLIDLLAVVPSVVGPQLAEARSAHIPVTLNADLDPSQQMPSGFDGGVDFPLRLSGQLEAAYAVETTHADAHLLSLVSLDLPQSKLVQDGINSELATLCPSCSVLYKNEPVADWSDLTSVTQSALATHPNISVVDPIYDSMMPFVQAGMAAAGKGSLPVTTYNGTPSVLKEIEDGSLVGMDVGISTQWMGYAEMYNDLLVLATGKDIVTTVPPRVFDAGNISDAGSPPTLTDGYGSNLIAPFEQLVK